MGIINKSNRLAFLDYILASSLILCLGTLFTKSPTKIPLNKDVGTSVKAAKESVDKATDIFGFDEACKGGRVPAPLLLPSTELQDFCSIDKKTLGTGDTHAPGCCCGGCSINCRTNKVCRDTPVSSKFCAGAAPDRPLCTTSAITNLNNSGLMTHANKSKASVVQESSASRGRHRPITTVNSDMLPPFEAKSYGTCKKDDWQKQCWGAVDNSSESSVVVDDLEVGEDGQSIEVLEELTGLSQRYVWKAQSGRSLRETIVSWAQSIGWDVAWESACDYQVTSTFSVYGTVVESMESVMGAYSCADAPLRADIYPLQSLIVVSNF